MASSSWARAPSKRFTAITNGMPRASQKSTDGNASSMRRLSTRITAPMAPRVTSSHANRKRDWPGVPNRYSTRPESREMRPKSRATVVASFVATAPSSVPRLISVSGASVVMGTISEMAPTKVVLPAP